MVDEPGAIPMFVDRQRVFPGQNDHTFLVLHKTASGGTAQDIANFFANDPRMASSHYVIGQDGTIVQVVQEVDGAGANCCLETGHAAFLPLGVNLNIKSVSIEHCDPSTSNDTPLTGAQKAASFRLVQHICERHNIPKRRATNDGQGGIIGHNDIAPLSRARCPNNYPWSELFAFLQGGNSMSGIPLGWRDTGTVLYSPSHLSGGPEIPVTGPFRDYILANAWRPSDRMIEVGHHVPVMQYADPSIGGGYIQHSIWSMLLMPDNGGGKVIYAWTGVENKAVRGLYEGALTRIAQLEQELAKLQQPVLDPSKVKDRLTAIGLASTNGNTAIQALVTQAIV